MWWLSSKEPACDAGDVDSIPGCLGSIPGSKKSPGEGNGNPLQYSCLGNPIDRGGWQATVHGVAKSQTRLKQLTTTCPRQKKVSEYRYKRIRVRYVWGIIKSPA